MSAEHNMEALINSYKTNVVFIRTVVLVNSVPHPNLIYVYTSGTLQWVEVGQPCCRYQALQAMFLIYVCVCVCFSSPEVGI